MMVTKE
jgi:hypothetical protein